MSSTQVAYTIDNEELRLEIAIVETEKLPIHEKTLPHRLERLKRRVYTSSQISKYLSI